MGEMFEPADELEDERARPGKMVVQAARYCSLLLVIILLLEFLNDKVTAHGTHSISTRAVVLAAFVLLPLFVLLALLVALQVAYTAVRDKQDDQFAYEAKTLLDEMRKNEDLVYGARDWAITMIVAVITLATEFHEPYIPGFRLHVPPPLEPLWELFAALLTAIPIIWFAQWPGEALAATNPIGVLMSLPMRSCWQIVKATSWIVRVMGLDIPERFIKMPLDQHLRSGLRSNALPPPLNLRPSDESFFLAGLQRYGFALHEISVRITIQESGACVVEQKLVWYLLRFTGTYFTRRLYFESRIVRSGPPHACGFLCPLVGDSYEPVAQLLDGIWDSSPPPGLVEVDPPQWTATTKTEPNTAGEVRLWIHTHSEFPRKQEAFAFRVLYQGDWDKNAFKVGHQESDSFEVTFEYPCRTYILEIIPDEGVDIRLVNLQAAVTIDSNLHRDEQQRLEEALFKDTDYADEIRQKGGIYCRFLYPIAGAHYKYSWSVAKRVSHPSPRALIEAPLIQERGD
jgi:hypothetical protein